MQVGKVEADEPYLEVRRLSSASLHPKFPPLRASHTDEYEYYLVVILGRAVFCFPIWRGGCEFEKVISPHTDCARAPTWSGFPAALVLSFQARVLEILADQTCLFLLKKKVFLAIALLKQLELTFLNVLYIPLSSSIRLAIVVGVLALVYDASRFLSSRFWLFTSTYLYAHWL